MTSVWKWLAVLVVFGGPVLLLVRDLRRRRAGAAAQPPLTGIRGWLALFAFLLCVGFAKGVAELALAVPDYLSGLQDEDARGPLAIVGMTALVAAAVIFGRSSLFPKAASRENRLHDHRDSDDPRSALVAADAHRAGCQARHASIGRRHREVDRHRDRHGCVVLVPLRVGSREEHSRQLRGGYFFPSGLPFASNSLSVSLASTPPSSSLLV